MSTDRFSRKNLAVETDLTRVEARYGEFFHPVRDNVIGRSLDAYGEWAQHEIDLAAKFIGPSDVVLDVGACIGTHSVAFASHLRDGGVVHAFEPFCRNFKVLQKNVSLPGRDNIVTHNVAVSNSVGTAAFFEGAENIGAGSIGSGPETSETAQVETVTLDGYGFARVDFIKIDVEGHESSVLAGASDILRNRRPVIYLEVNDIDCGARSLETIQPFEYMVYGDVSTAFNPNNFFGNAEDIYQGGKECALLLVPAEKIGRFEGVISSAGLMPVKTLDDLAALLLQKPQYWQGTLGKLAWQGEISPPFVTSLKENASKLKENASKLERRITEISQAASERDGRIEELSRTSDELRQDRDRLLAELSTAKVNAANMEELVSTLMAKEDDFLDFLDLSERQWDQAMRVVRKARALPAGLHFRARPRYRRITRKLVGEDEQFRIRMKSQRASVEAAIAAHEEFIASLTEQDHLRRASQVCAEGFDRDYYLRHNADVAAAGVDPLSHFVQTGWREGRNPAPWFDLDYYLKMHPHLAEAGVNPLLHYLQTGRSNGHLTTHPGGEKVALLDKRKDPKPVHYENVNFRVLGRSDLSRALRAALERSGNRLQLSFSHSDWKEAVGGTEVCLQIEAQACNGRGITHLVLHPLVQTWKVSEHEDTAAIELGVYLDGERLGISSYDAVAGALASVRTDDGHFSVTIHHILGHQVSGMIDVALSTGTQGVQFYLHDYLTVCTQCNLLRNDISFCGGPDITSGSCRICYHGAGRKAHLERVKPLFEALNVTLVSPSQAALDVWTAATNLKPARTAVQPHITLASTPRAEPCTVDMARPARIGFVGARRFHKG
jgi:FkbM family methyltransferase